MTDVTTLTLPQLLARRAHDTPDAVALRHKQLGTDSSAATAPPSRCAQETPAAAEPGYADATIYLLY